MTAREVGVEMDADSGGVAPGGESVAGQEAAAVDGEPVVVASAGEPAVEQERGGGE